VSRLLFGAVWGHRAVTSGATNDCSPCLWWRLILRERVARRNGHGWAVGGLRASRPQRDVSPFRPAILGSRSVAMRHPAPEVIPSKSPAMRGFPDAPGEIRTPDLRFRRPTLYPAELRALAGIGECTIVAAGRRPKLGTPDLGDDSLGAGRSSRRADRLGQPLQQCPGGPELRAHALVAPRLVQPRLEWVAARDGQLPAA
jgi:hypothetical protein